MSHRNSDEVLEKGGKCPSVLNRGKCLTAILTSFEKRRKMPNIVQTSFTKRRKMSHRNSDEVLEKGGKSPSVLKGGKCLTRSNKFSLKGRKCQKLSNRKYFFLKPSPYACFLCSFLQ